MKMLALLMAFAIATASPADAQSREEVRFVKAIFAQILARSQSENREYCGYIGRNAAGKLAVSKMTRGRRDSCSARWPDDLDVVASFHTHAGFDVDAQSEVPSVNDMEADEDEGIDGYVATPGGRLWYIDTTDMVASQLCGIGCLAKDPRFRPGADGQILKSYRYEDLLRREAES